MHRSQMPEANRLRIVQVNAVYDAAARTAPQLLDAYPTLCEWSDTLQAAGALVATVQRFHEPSLETRGDAHYVFVRDSGPPLLPWWRASRKVCDAVRAWRPDVVHVNGLQFPALLRGLRSSLAPSVAIVAQDHAGQPPRVPRVLGDMRRWLWRRGLSAADACSFTAARQAMPWRDAGFLPDGPVLEILEGSTRMRAQSRENARAITGLDGTPAILWVGRLTANKDPMTVLSGLELALPHLPHARAHFVYADGDLADRIRERVEASTVLRNRVALIGAVPHRSMAAFFSAADIYISGSHREGSGYALIEALACGLRPVVTDIPSFRAIAEPHGFFWTPGDPASCAAALRRAATDSLAGAETRRRHFEQVLSWPAIGARTLEAYQAIVDRRRAHTG
jgi:glycosyltransferase involved in cell wall biosynthesis